jgi:hypothetical protein
MDINQVELLISQAIKGRPITTSATMNLYISNSKLICGARILMPKDAQFICHLSPEVIQDGFDEKSWKNVVEKAFCFLNNGQAPSDTKAFKNRRIEDRLKLSGNIFFDFGDMPRTLQGQLVDLSSQGMAFNCYNRPNLPAPGSEITTKFTVPFLTEDGKAAGRKFTRTAKICRTVDTSSYLKKIAVQFVEPLPFKPAEYSQLADTDVQLI